MKTRIKTACTHLLLGLVFIAGGNFHSLAQVKTPVMHYTVTAPRAAAHYFHVELSASNFDTDSLLLKLPQWTPGYYQLLNFYESIENIRVTINNNPVTVTKVNNNSWKMGGIKNKTFKITYDVKADKQFVARSYVDESRGYIIPGSLFFYADTFLDLPVSLTIDCDKKWTFATGLDLAGTNTNTFIAPNFDVLYDSPILFGPLEELPSFTVNGINHQFIGYKIGSFDQALFMDNLKKIVQVSSKMIGDIPYTHYTFIGIGPGRGGIEHLNNTTVSFDGSDLHKPDVMNRTLNFLAHEYFHHYNVKRIRPYELGPFNYDQGSKTNLLWVSEGLSVYYEYLIVRRAGLSDNQTLLSNFNRNINTIENNPGKLFQSLVQASYETWNDGPFGTQGKDPGKSISYYEKGPVVGLLLDFAIRHVTKNRKSLDDVMRLLYWKYYKDLNRGFTDAEFQQTCENVAGEPLTELFEYVYTTKELNYDKYLGYAGLKLGVETNEKNEMKKYTILPLANIDSLQSAIFDDWVRD